ncbi:MAG: NAD(P)H-dependent oxidoreductase [Actinobacteria bacterium]|nr:NAD(P)H-dependent oxidoreductase [Thermoleophilia bacterium]MCB9010345.1 NAD(P)H-dependent oxidoreductase [Actinomycetota bacterium]
MKILIITGSTRPGRAGEAVGNWVHRVASQRSDATYELVDLADYELELLNEPTVPGAANGNYDNAATRRWSEKIASADGFVFVTPEYNHGVPAAMKNSFDVLYPEWMNKAVTFVSYGADAGVRAVENWRVIVINAFLYATRSVVSLSLFTDFGEGGFAPQDRRAGELNGALDELVPLAGAVKTLRS